MFGSDSRMTKKMREGRVKMMAAAWFARMRSDERTPDDERRLKAWLESAAEHEAAYAGVCRSYATVGLFAETPEIRGVRQIARRRPHPVQLLLATPPRRAAAAAIAACLVLALAGAISGAPWMAWGSRDIYQTRTGERSTIALNDGTSVTLTSDSRVVADFSPHLRRVRLEKGEAYFDVVHDSGRPFVVEAGPGEITDVGTVFDVYSANDKVVVTLVKGLVKVSAADKQDTDDKTVNLQPGEQVSYGKGKLSQVRAVDAEGVVSWRKGYITAGGRPFISVVRQYNRHSKYKLYVDEHDPRFRKLTIDGFFTIDRPQGLVPYVKVPGTRVHTDKDSSGNIRLRLLPTTSGG